MGAGLYDKIPGLREAENRYRESGFEAFSGVEPSICGTVEVLPLTPQMFLELEGCENAFLFNRPIKPADILQFLWRVSPVFSRTDNEKQSDFNKAAGGLLNYEDAIQEICEYILRAFANKPDYGTLNAQSVAAWPSYLVDIFATNYHWTEQEVLNLPYRRLWQYYTRIIERKDPDFNERPPEVRRLMADFLTDLNKKLAAEKAGAK